MRQRPRIDQPPLQSSYARTLRIGTTCLEHIHTADRPVSPRIPEARALAAEPKESACVRAPRLRGIVDIVVSVASAWGERPQSPSGYASFVGFGGQGPFGYHGGRRRFGRR